jgi:hypothetical protein
MHPSRQQNDGVKKIKNHTIQILECRVRHAHLLKHNYNGAHGAPYKLQKRTDAHLSRNLKNKSTALNKANLHE